MSAVTPENAWDEGEPRIIPRVPTQSRNPALRLSHSDETLGQGEYGDHATGSLDGHLDEHHEQQAEYTTPEEDKEKGSHGKQQQPVGFFSSELKGVRRKVFPMWIATVLMLATFILSVMSIYWGVLSHVDENRPALKIYVVDFDGQIAPYISAEQALVGPLVVKTAMKQNSSPKPHVGYFNPPPSFFNNDPMQVREAIYAFDAWAALIVNPNATALLRAAVSQGNASYDPLGACQFVYVEARDQTTYPEYIYPELNQLQTEIVSQFGKMWTGVVMGNSSIPRQNLQKAPQALSPAIGFSQYNLRPFGPPQAIPTVNIGLIYLIIVAFFSFPFFMPIHSKFMSPEGHPPLHFRQLILWRWISAILIYFFLSLAYSFVSLAFQIPFNNPPAPHTEVASNPNAYHRGTFPVYWMINFVGMIALGLCCENVAMVVGQPWMALWLIFWVITNVSTGFYSLELAPRFFYWGYAWPLHNIVEATRSTLFDLHSRIGLNFGVLFAWCAVNTALFPLCCWFMRWKTMRQKKKQQ